MKLLLIDHEDSFVYNLAQAFARLGAEVRVARYTESFPKVARFNPDAIVLSPGPGSPGDRRVTGLARQFLAGSDGRWPVLGVCLGHQLIGEFFGASVVRARAPVHGETANVLHHQVGLFEGLPSPFAAARYHSLVLDPNSIPLPLTVTATTSEGVVMAVQHARLPIYGVQFHPESYLTREGPHLLANYLRQSRK